MVRRILGTLALLALALGVMGAVTLTPKLKLYRGWVQGQSGWGAGMNANLDRIDAVSVRAVLEGEDVQAAIDSTPDYGTLRIGEGSFMPPDTNGYIIDHPITIEGSGRPYIYENIGPPKTEWTHGTRFQFYNASATDSNGAKNSTLFRIVGPVVNVTLKNFGIENHLGKPTDSTGSGDGIRINAAGGYVGHINIESVAVLFAGRNGIRMVGQSFSIPAADQSTFEHIQIGGSGRDGIYAYYPVSCLFQDVLLVGNRNCGIYAYGASAVQFRECLFNGNGSSFGVEGGWPYYHYAQLYLQGSMRFVIDACDFEVWNTKTIPRAIGLEAARGGSITNCSTYNPTYPTPGVESEFVSMLSQVSGVYVAGNHVGECTHYVQMLSGHSNRGNIIMPPLVEPSDVDGGSLCRITTSAETDTATIVGVLASSGGNFVFQMLTDASAYNTDKIGPQFAAGIQFPVVSDTAAFTNPAKQRGTLFYVARDSCFYYWTGAKFRKLQPVLP